MGARVFLLHGEGQHILFFLANGLGKHGVGGVHILLAGLICLLDRWAGVDGWVRPFGICLYRRIDWRWVKCRIRLLWWASFYV